MTLALLIRLRESSQERYFSEKGVLINDLKASGLGTDLKSLVYLSNTPVIVLLFFFVGMPPIRDLVSHSPNQSGDAQLFQSHLFHTVCL